ncbi:MAG: extracellular solute-binding protein [Treponema sp.]|jgi:spermidine/putrescine transport system substrate-binding protein|nr:extracellular solute-binding protein [Treponema sp.]
MKKKVIIFHAVLTVLILPVILSCDSRPRLYIYNWTYYTPDSVIEKFEKEFNVRVIYDEFASNEEMFAKLMASRGGRSSYDVVFPSKYFVPIMIKEGLLEKIDIERLSNLENIDPKIQSLSDHDLNMDYSIPYYYGAAGILVNTSRVSNYEQSWAMFERTDLRGRMVMLDDMREVMGGALSYLGFSVNTANPTEVNAARDLINLRWKPNLVKFDSEAFGLGYINGEFWVVHGFPEAIYEEIADEDGNFDFRNNAILKDTHFFFPKEGGPSYLDYMVILKDARNIDMAHTFIDFIHRPEIYAEIVDAFGLPATVNIPARQHKKGYSFYSVEDLLNTQLVDDVKEAQEFYSNAWFNTIRAGD